MSKGFDYKMKQIWSFSPSSEVYLERILRNATGADQNGKWLRLFSDSESAVIKQNYERKMTNKVDTLNENTTFIADEAMEVEETTVENDKSCDESIKTLIEFLESEDSENFPEIIHKCQFNGTSCKILIESMTEKTAERFYKFINSAETLNTVFIQSFLATFLPQFLKLKQSRLHLDLLTMGYKKYGDHFKTLFLPVALKHESPFLILNDFAQSLSEVEKSDVLNSISTINLDCNNFNNNINTIVTLYNGAAKSDNIQRFIVKLLVENLETCSGDKIFGRLLYLYLSSLKEKPADLSKLELIVENHRSPMKRACMSILRKLSI